MELHLKYRPSSFKKVLGQDEAVKILSRKCYKGTVPHAILFSGPSGVGKTTLARIVAKKIGCLLDDITEVNCADFRGIDTIRGIREVMELAPLGSARCWIVDEFHQMTGAAQDSFLKTLEEPPSHVYFIICTTEPSKLKSTIITRCMHIKLKPLRRDCVEAVIIRALGESTITKEVVDKIIEVADGSARKALVILEQVLELETEEEQMEAVIRSDIQAKAFDLARALMYRKPWNVVTKILSTVEEDPEVVRLIVLKYAHTTILGGGKMAARAFLMITAFDRDYRLNAGADGKASLAASAYALIHGK